jgi:hypothetical protein
MMGRYNGKGIIIIMKLHVVGARGLLYKYVYIYVGIIYFKLPESSETVLFRVENLEKSQWRR